MNIQYKSIVGTLGDFEISCGGIWNIHRFISFEIDKLSRNVGLKLDMVTFEFMRKIDFMSHLPRLIMLYAINKKWSKWKEIPHFHP